MNEKPLGGLARLGLNAIGLYVMIIIMILVIGILNNITEALGILSLPLMALGIWGFFRYQKRRDQQRRSKS